jgi:hypothetical protein
MELGFLKNANHDNVDQHPRRGGVFDGPKSFRSATDEMPIAGVHRSELNLLAGKNTARKKPGRRHRNPGKPADGPDGPRVAYASPEAIDGAEEP